ncbi:MAG: hypothetical protein KJ914_07720 [Gammaproteobacteria bacterium]|nr:hypothetical protein [Gammaproteobacteria bacterium]MBU1723976.1 hypothetical protein [Gammaproteobacteria bacterium]MBU2007169.1 hypothetical protein [Gammaproteobacteria bacterium]
MNIGKNRALFANLLIIGAIVTLVAIYFTPVWWVSLTAPNYPEEAFPDGVRIHFGMSGVTNGCQKVEKAEISEGEALDCVHEMDTINHYVGMYPIAAGGVVEKAFSPFLTGLLIVMLLGFLFSNPKARAGVMALGFGGIVVWMAMTWYGADGLKYQSTAYVYALVTSLDQDTSRDEGAADAESDSGIVARLKASMAKSTGTAAPDAAAAPPATPAKGAEKDGYIQHLQVMFEKAQERKPAAERQTWNGSGSQVMSWHYGQSLGRYFNNPAEILPMVRNMSFAAQVVFWGIPLAMLLLLWGAWKSIRPLYWLLILVPLALPLFFIIEYSGWLWWYGHSLNAMGAFTVKPFMPTVFGQGKVAQFTTHSYPYIGFFLMLLSTGMLSLAALLRRKQLQAGE